MEKRSDVFETNNTVLKLFFFNFCLSEKSNLIMNYLNKKCVAVCLYMSAPHCDS